MTTKELIEMCKRDTHYPKYQCEQIIFAFLRLINESLTSGEDVGLFGVGNIKLTTTKPRTVYYTGEPMEIPAYKKARFYISPTLKKEIRKLPV